LPGRSAGTYYLTFQKPTGTTFTLQGQGSDLSGSDVNAAGITALFSLLASESKDFDAVLYWL
jgi:hypothetical protein